MIVTKENLKIKKVKEEGNLGTYSFEPLPSGFGTTLGNSLRRVLLTSIEGAAITQIKVKGTSHQFTTLPGVKEDIVEITLNLKKVRIKMHGDQPVVATLKKKGKGKVTAGDIDAPSETEIINKKQHIATLSDTKTELEIELVIEPGAGYSPMEERQTSKVGVVILDALFSPIKRVTYNVAATRFEGRTDLDKLTLTIETDGSIKPQEALEKASGILMGYYEIIKTGEDATTREVEEEKEDVSAKLEQTEDIAVDELPLQTRTINALKKNGVDTLHKLAEKPEDELADIKNLGEKSLAEINKLLKKEGLKE
jgi:DNA-directed RNA polymerase subunit alpha